MTLDDLDSQIESDSAQQVPPFGASSVSMAQALGARATSLLLGKIRDGRPSAFIALEALRGSDPGAFEQVAGPEKAAIYVAELRRNIFFNGWGLPGFQLTSTALALIALGEIAVPALADLLVDTREAPSSGSEDATTSSIYGNRVCDYAWVFINEIRNCRSDYPENAADRDKGIAALLRSLRAEGIGPQ